jgi:hypothetical protein
MFEYLKEVIVSLRKTSSERISNPFYGVFILTWIAFNWESVAILLFSDMAMDERVRFINSAYPIVVIIPFLVSVVLTFIVPYCNEKITYLQSSPLGRTSTLLALRRKRSLIADISVERYRAKKDVAYERYKVGAEKEVQDMKESIVRSTERTGELTESLRIANNKIAHLQQIEEKAKRYEEEILFIKENRKDLQIDLDEKSDAISGLKKELSSAVQTGSAVFIENEKRKATIDEIIYNYPDIFYWDDEKLRLKIKPGVREIMKNLQPEAGSLSMTDALRRFGEDANNFQKK